jgi:ATP-dependent helicase/nuclease subunit A
LIALSYFRGASKYWRIKETEAITEEEQASQALYAETKFEENQKISRLLDYEYPYKQSINLPNKASVSLLKSMDFNLAPSHDGNIPMINKPVCKKTELKKPDFKKDKQRGTFFGTAHHKLLQYVNYNCTSVRKECDRLFQKGLLTEDEYNVIDIKKIEDFLSSTLGEMLKSADKVFREEAFVISISAKEVDSSLPETESLCVQGVIDCYFEYDGKIILVDYKTDVYDQPSEIALKYSKQLYYYEKALKTKYKTKNVQKFLYLMHKNDIIEV